MKGGTALLIIDMLNTLEFPEWKSLIRHAVPAAREIQRLKARLEKCRIPVIYVNDNFGRWQSDWQKLFEICSGAESRGAPLAERLRPSGREYFVLKPKNSGFFATPLDLLLRELRVKQLVLTGIAGNNCVLFTAHDAHMRGYRVIIPKDCVASNSVRENNEALRLLSATIRPHIAAKAKSLRIKR